uniref:Uncharacterized protein n=1 Tax=Oryza punctata TaxID=4537 RepID=A0A0E0JKF5_ORYPU
MEFSGGATVSAPFGCCRAAWGGGGGQRLRGAAAAAAAEGRRRALRAGTGVVEQRCGRWMVRCVATEKHKDAARLGGVEFADEEDYVKGGGGELLYVQMQASKSMDSQSKISSKSIEI